MVPARLSGSVEFCDQHGVRGWTNAPLLDVYVNGECAGAATIGAVRDDSAALGLDDVRSFQFAFPSPLWLDDRVTLRLPDNTLLSPAQDVSHLVRLMLLVSGLDFTRPGLEFGPLHRPTVPRGRAEVYYIDHDDQDGLRRKCAEMPQVDGSRIQPVDYVWADGNSLSRLVRMRKFGWVIASHVGEHIADFIGWIQEVEAVLEDRGCLSLALPHGERTFDACRPISTFEELLAAYLARLDRPSPLQVLRHFVGVAEWSGASLKKSENTAGLHHAIMMARHAQSGTYIDVHCNVFTPKSFTECYNLMQRCGLVHLGLKSVMETEGQEFFVHLTNKSS